MESGRELPRGSAIRMASIRFTKGGVERCSCTSDKRVRAPGGENLGDRRLRPRGAA